MCHWQEFCNPLVIQEAFAPATPDGAVAGSRVVLESDTRRLPR
jgi:hypothetical protein